MAMLVTDTYREMLFVFPGLRIMAVYRKFKRYFANDHCCWYLLSTPVELVPSGQASAAGAESPLKCGWITEHQTAAVPPSAARFC